MILYKILGETPLPGFAICHLAGGFTTWFGPVRETTWVLPKVWDLFLVLIESSVDVSVFPHPSHLY